MAALVRFWVHERLTSEPLPAHGIDHRLGGECLPDISDRERVHGGHRAPRLVGHRRRWRTGLTVQFHFDYDDQDVSIRSTRSGSTAVTVTLRYRQHPLIRGPGWGPPDSVAFESAGHLATPLWVGTFAFFGGEQVTGPITLTYDLPATPPRKTSTPPTTPSNWRGDEILGISPNTEYLPFYPTVRWHA